MDLSRITTVRITGYFLTVPIIAFSYLSIYFQQNEIVSRYERSDFPNNTAIITHVAMPFPDFRETVAKQGVTNAW